MRLSLLLLGLYLLAAILTAFGLFTPAIDLADMQADAAPNPGAWFGTDHLGRDVLAQTVQGTRVALSVGTLAAGLAVLLGALFGVLAGWYGGRLDALILWLSGSVAAIPGILLVLVLSWMLGGGYVGVFLAVGLVSWVGIYRLVRVEVQRLRSEPFVLSSRSFGARFSGIAWHHLLPNLAPLLGTQFLLHFLFAVKAEVILSFLGIGMQGYTSWGTMIADAWAFDDLGQQRWWRLSAATGAMALLILSLQRIAMRIHMRAR